MVSMVTSSSSGKDNFVLKFSTNVFGYKSTYNKNQYHTFKQAILKLNSYSTNRIENLILFDDSNAAFEVVSVKDELREKRSKMIEVNEKMLSNYEKAKQRIQLDHSKRTRDILIESEKKKLIDETKEELQKIENKKHLFLKKNKDRFMPDKLFVTNYLRSDSNVFRKNMNMFSRNGRLRGIFSGKRFVIDNSISTLNEVVHAELLKRC